MPRCFPTALVPVLLAAGCASGSRAVPFDLQYPASPAAALASAAERVASAPPPESPAAVAIVPAPPARGFTVFDLPSGRRLGQVGAPIDGRPTLLGDLVVAHAQGAVVAWTLDGTERWRIADQGLGLDGAARDGDRVVLTLGGAGVTRRDGSLVIADARTGAVSVRSRVQHALGLPAAGGGVAFVPWDGQNLSVFDLGDGGEIARVRSRDDVVGFARREGAAVYFGARALYRLAPEDALGRRDGAPHYALTRDDLPGGPPFAADGFTAPRAGLDARGRVRVAWRPDPTAPGAALTDNTVYAVFYRDVFALDATTGTVRWAYVHPADLAGVEVVRGGIALVDEQGRAALLAAPDGRPAWRTDLGAPAAQAVFQLPADFHPPSQGGDAPRGATDGLLEAAGGTDTRLMPAQLFAVRALAAMDSPEATRALVAILGHRSYPQDLRAAAGEALAHRTTGSDALIEALDTHYDYVRQTDAPPVGLLARGIAAAHDTRGAAALVAHLADPATPLADLPALVAALRVLNDPVALPALVDFVRLYHADVGAVPPVGGGDPIDDRLASDQDTLSVALEQAVQAIARMGGPADFRVLDDLLADPNSPQAVRVATARARGGGAHAPAGSEGAPDAAPEGVPTPTFQMPASYLAADAIADGFAPHRDELLGCLRDAPSRPAQVRLEFFYDSEGHVTHVTVTPARFGACMSPLVERVQLPASQVGREIGTYNLNTSGP